MKVSTEEAMELGEEEVKALNKANRELSEVTAPTVQRKFPEHHTPTYPTRRVAGNPDITMEG